MKISNVKKFKPISDVQHPESHTQSHDATEQINDTHRKAFGAATSSTLLYIAIFAIGGVGYGLIEIAFRGHTHWTMLLTGGACFLTIYFININMPTASILLRAFLGAFAITSYELIVGCIVNLWFKLDVWDYSDRAFSLYGQICPLFSFIWFLLSLCLAIALHLLYNMNRN